MLKICTAVALCVGAAGIAAARYTSGSPFFVRVAERLKEATATAYKNERGGVERIAKSPLGRTNHILYSC